MNKRYLISVCFLSLLYVFVGSNYACSNILPTAVAVSDANSISDPNYVFVGDTVSFDGSNSFDTDGDVVAYRWTFPPEAYTISGENTANAKCKFYPAGSYEVHLKVQDNDGAWSENEAKCDIIVKAATWTDWYVKTDGNDDDNGTSWNTAFANIQTGIGSASYGDTVFVGTGTYYESIYIDGRNITLCNSGPNDWDVVAATIIDANNTGPVVTFAGTEDPNCHLTGFTITGGLADVKTGLEAYWKLDGDPNDSSGNGHDGTVNGDPNWVAGPFDNAIELDGDGDYINTGFILDPADGAFSACAWVKGGTDRDNIMCQTDGPSTGPIWLFTDRNSYLSTTLRVSGSIGLFSTYSGHTDGYWHHVAMVYDGKRRYLYADGDLVASDSSDLSGSLEACDGNLYIGAHKGLGALSFWEGLIDEARVYDRALSEAEIRNLNLSGGGISGGGINGSESQAAISWCIITDNTADFGGGVADFWGSITNCIITENTAKYYGGGMNNCDTVTNCTIVYNEALDSGGIEDCDSITNSIIWGNDPNQLYNCPVVTYSCIQDWTGGGTGNITYNPVFVDFSGGDYHLDPNSPCIDAGDPSSDYSNEPDPNGYRINMGAYGNTCNATRTLDNDGDGLTNSQETVLGTNPYDSDSDDDGLSDGDEVNVYNTNPLNWDTDGDGLPDGWEIDNDLDPLDATGENGAAGDPDEDQISNLLEYQSGLDPQVDNDGDYFTMYEYDGAGQVTLQRDVEVSNGNVWLSERHTEYDVLGRPEVERRLVDPGFGLNRGPDNANDIITAYTYDVAGSLKKTIQKAPGNTDPDDEQTGDIVTENFYDSLGRVTKVVDPAGGETTYTYNLAGQVKTTENPDGFSTTNCYDDEGRLNKVVDAEGHYRMMGYDSLGRVIREKAYDVTDANEPAVIMQKRFVYDGMGHITRQAVLAYPAESNDYVIDPNTDMVTDFVYDGYYGDYPGLLVSQKIYYGGSPSTVATTTFEYDGLGRRTKTTDPAGNETIGTYDSMGRITRRQQKDYHPLQGGTDLVMTTDYEYDDFGRLKKQIAKPNTDPNYSSGWQTTEYGYALGNRIKETKPNSVIVTHTFNALGQKTKMVADSAGGGIKQTTEYSHNRLGRQVSISGYTDETDNDTKQTTVYNYDELARVTGIIYPDANSISFNYNAGGKVTRRIDQRGWITWYDYDDVYNLAVKTTDPNLAEVLGLIIIDPNNTPDPNDVFLLDAVTAQFGYDGLGRMISAEKSVNKETISNSAFVYNGLGKITDANEIIFDASEKHIGYTYDQMGFLTSTTYPDGSTTIDRTNDHLGRIDTLSRSSTTLVDYAYIGPRVAQRSYPVPNPDIDYEPTYDNLGRITIANYGASVAKFDYSYVTNENNIDTKTFDHRSGDPYNDYGYDDIDRMTSVTYHDFDTESFAMDDLGNRDGNQTLRDEGTVNFTVDDDTNRYTSIGGNSISHDNAGNLTIDKDGYQYEYDYENRLIKIEDVNDVEVATFDYDPLGRRIRKVDSKANETTLYYYNDNWQVLAEYNDSDVLQCYFVYGNYIDEVLLMNDGTNDYYYVHDHIYSPAALLNSSGTVVERYEYNAYGKMTRLDPDFTPWSGTEVGNPYYFTGRRLDKFDGEALEKMHYRHREYSPFMGRFYQHDPLSRGPRIAHTSYGPQWVETNGPQIAPPQTGSPTPIAPNTYIPESTGNSNMDHAIAVMGSVSQLNIPPQVAAQQQYASLKNRVQTVVISVHDAQSHLQVDRLTVQEQLNIPEDQYLDGMNLYQYVKSNPINYVDSFGTNIYLITGNDSSWNPFTNSVHQKVCVDLWKADGTTWITDGKKCFSFKMTGPGLTPPKKTWLGFKSVVLGGCLKGIIYQDDYTGGDIVRWKLTTPRQDIGWFIYMLNNRDGTKDAYSVLRHNCRLYSQLEFDAAPGIQDVDGITGAGP
jgi:YD repeat-containing protein